MRSPPRTGPAPPNSSSPLANEMPDELRPLAHRYAVRLRDESWRQEVDALIERLKAGGQPLDRTSGGSPPSSWLVLCLVGWAWASGNRGGDGDASPPDSRPRLPAVGDSHKSPGGRC